MERYQVMGELRIHCWYKSPKVNFFPRFSSGISISMSLCTSVLGASVVLLRDCVQAACWPLCVELSFLGCHHTCVAASPAVCCGEAVMGRARGMGTSSGAHMAGGDSKGDREKAKQMSQVLWAGLWLGGDGCLECCRFCKSSKSLNAFFFYLLPKHLIIKLKAGCFVFFFFAS